MIVLESARHESARNHAFAPVKARAGLLARLSPDDYAALTQGRRSEIFQPGDTVWRPGDDMVVFVERGAAAPMTALAGGVEAGAGFCVSGDAPGLGEALAAGDSGERGAALLPGSAIRVSAAVVRRLWRDSAAFREAATLQTVMEAACARRWCACQSRHSVDARVAALLLRLHRAAGSSTLRTTQEVASAVLGVQRTTVSQSASKLQSDGAVRWRRAAVDLLDLDKLRHRACDCPDETDALRAAYA